MSGFAVESVISVFVMGLEVVVVGNLVVRPEKHLSVIRKQLMFECISVPQLHPFLLTCEKRGFGIHLFIETFSK